MRRLAGLRAIAAGLAVIVALACGIGPISSS